MPRSSSGITYRPTPGLTPDQARDARARAWRFVFERWEQKKAPGKDGGEGEAKHNKNEGGPSMP